MEDTSKETQNELEISDQNSRKDSCKQGIKVANDISDSNSIKTNEEEDNDKDKVVDDLKVNASVRCSVIKEHVSNLVEQKANILASTEGFKKPTLLIGPRRGHVGKIRTLQNIPSSPQQSCEDTSKDIISVTTEEDIKATEIEEDKESSPLQSKPVVNSSKDIPLSYKEPPWGGLPNKKYEMEVLKSGVILDTIDLSKQSFHVIGRLPSCNLSLAHPTISRYHAILQYRVVADDKNAEGLYLYDLGSTHGTFWNGNRIRPHIYVRVRGGHMIRFGCSNRKYILQAPDDLEEESELSVTELKEKRRLELEERERIELERQVREDEEERLKKEKEETEGVDWGMGEDADEESDLTENPFATTTNEELFLDDPKKTLRGWFEREGYDLQYQTEEKGVGQFLCWVNLPIDTIVGHPVRAEALVKGKKKESVIQCALEACRILDRHGLLRQANHEARKRKSKNWEEQDYYDSDEDNFLDRTGSVEKKREKRMRQAGKLETKVETYTTLLEKHTEVAKEIQNLENSLRKSVKSKRSASDEADEDELDAFMSNLNTSTLSKSEISRIKLELQGLRKEEERLIKLVNLTRPTDLPPLKPHITASEKDSPEKMNKSSGNVNVCIGHMKKSKSLIKKPLINVQDTSANAERSQAESESDEEMDENNESTCKRRDDDADVNDETIDNVKSTENKNRSEGGPKIKNNPSKDKKEVDIKETNNEITDEDTAMEKLKTKQKTRNRKKAEKAAKEMEKSLDQNMYGDNYSTWVPPKNQTGDGKTNLNEKYGY